MTQPTCAKDQELKKITGDNGCISYVCGKFKDLMMGNFVNKWEKYDLIGWEKVLVLENTLNC